MLMNAKNTLNVANNLIIIKKLAKKYLLNDER